MKPKCLHRHDEHRRVAIGALQIRRRHQDQRLVEVLRLRRAGREQQQAANKSVLHDVALHGESLAASIARRGRRRRGMTAARRQTLTKGSDERGTGPDRRRVATGEAVGR